jgi:purine-cytosine permease-like protein
MGYWPSNLVAVLNIIFMIGYCVISCILRAQILSAVSEGSMSVVVGISITALINWLVAVLGILHSISTSGMSLSFFPHPR